MPRNLHRNVREMAVASVCVISIDNEIENRSVGSHMNCSNQATSSTRYADSSTRFQENLPRRKCMVTSLKSCLTHTYPCWLGCGGIPQAISLVLADTGVKRESGLPLGEGLGGIRDQNAQNRIANVHSSIEVIRSASRMYSRRHEKKFCSPQDE